jgi:hypothetical protein
VAEGILPPLHKNVDGTECEHYYQFFMTQEPDDIIEGFGAMQYNAGKGFIAGSVLAVTAPFKDAHDRFVEVRSTEEGNLCVKETDEIGGFEGGVRGFGEGAARGFVGWWVLTAAGAAYGAGQFARGFVSLKNIPMFVAASNTAVDEYWRLTKDPIKKLVLQKGFGLEDWLVADHAAEEEFKASEAIRVGGLKTTWESENKGQEYPGEKPVRMAAKAAARAKVIEDARLAREEAEEARRPKEVAAESQ